MGDKCSACGKSEVRNRNVEGTSVDLCGECSVEYQCEWRPIHSPVNPDVRRFIRSKKTGDPL